MNIVLHSSDSFSSVLAVSMVSVLENNPKEKIDFYVIEHGITDRHKRMIEQMVLKYPNGRISFVPMPDINKQYKLGLKQIKSTWLFDAYCRLFLGSILPDDVDRALFLDCDTLCNGSISEFYNTDLGDNLAAGVIDCLSDAYYDLFNMDETSRYCNSGVVLLDLKKWREQHIESAITEYVRKNNGYVFFMEQSVMNIVLQNKIKIVHPCNNTYTLMVAFSHENLRRLRKCKRYYSDEEIDEAISKPTLIHLTTNFYVKGRPWVKGNKHPFSQLFRRPIHMETKGYCFHPSFIAANVYLLRHRVGLQCLASSSHSEEYA